MSRHFLIFTIQRSGVARYALHTNTNIRYSWNLVCYGLCNEQNCRMFVRRLFFSWIFTKIIFIRPKIFWPNKIFIRVFSQIFGFIFRRKILFVRRFFVSTNIFCSYFFFWQNCSKSSWICRFICEYLRVVWSTREFPRRFFSAQMLCLLCLITLTCYEFVFLSNHWSQGQQW